MLSYCDVAMPEFDTAQVTTHPTAELVYLLDKSWIHISSSRTPESPTNHLICSAFQMASYSASSGTLGVSAYLPLFHIPSIISEWSALFPLVCHLANYGEDHRMVGELALAGHLTVGLFPKLGYLDGIRRLLEGGPDFFDRTNAKSESNFKVWDVNWGSVFTRANGAAPSIITDYALRKHEKAISMPEQVLAEPRLLSGATGTASPGPNPPKKTPIKPGFRRYQELHIIRVSRKSRTRTWKGTLLLLMISRLGKFSYHLFLVGLVVLLCLLGAFGSAAILANGLISKVVCRVLRAERPSGYLENNETHGACMLSAVHENANTWYLYVGDRGVIDSLLNKPMLSSPSANRILMAYFRLAHVSQLLAMTFVAAQKGIDGVSLVVLLLINYSFQYLLGGHRIGRQWLEKENVSVDAHNFRFTGRTAMMGAVHLISEARSAAWMDSLLTPCPRITAWLDRLNCATGTGGRAEFDVQALCSSDRSWVLLNSQLAIEAARLIRSKLSQGKSVESLYIKEGSQRS